MLVTETLTGNTGITQNVKWGGGSFAVAFNNNRQEQSDLFATRNPAINANFTAVYVQPLLRSFRIDGTRAALQHHRDEPGDLRDRVAGDHRADGGQRAQRVLGLRLRDSGAGSRRRSLALASKLVEDNQARVEVGTLAPLDVVQAQAEQATRRQAVATAATTRAHREIVAEATHRQRHRRSVLGRQPRADRSSRRSDPDAGRRRRRCAGRWRTAPTSSSRASRSSRTTSR